MSRNLIICTDGTWNSPDQEDRGRLVPSNVVKLCRATAGSTKDGTEQLVYYDTGVGTGSWWDRIKGGAFGVGLAENVKQAYRAIGHAYRPRDNLFLFGFSRGAYSARSIAGLIGLCGIPDPAKGDVNDIMEAAFKLYRLDPRDANNRRKERVLEHRKAHSHTEGDEVLNEVCFLGVWDTVGALGIPLQKLNWIGRHRHKFHDTTLGPHTKNAFHALAIDEHRKPFQPTVWLSKNVHEGQTVEQNWFTGVHTNVGGGYLDTGLSDRTFLWMCLRARDAGMGFNTVYMNNRLDPDYHGELRDSMSTAYRMLGPVTRQIGGMWTAPDDGERYPAAGEAIHFSARNRYEDVTEGRYREMHDKLEGSLKDALQAQPPVLTVAESSPDETDYHGGPSVAPLVWNESDDSGPPQRFR